MTSAREGAPRGWGWGGAGGWGWGAVPDDATVELIAQLSMEFEPLVDAETVAAIVLECRRDLYAAPDPASLQSLEQLARRRLHDLTGPAYAITTVANNGAAAGSSADLIVRLLTE